MVKSVLPSSHIKGVAVCEKRLSAQTLYHVCYGFRVIGTEIGQIAGLSEMNFNGGVSAVEVDGLNAGPADQALQLFLQAVTVVHPQVRKIHF